MSGSPAARRAVRPRGRPRHRRPQGRAGGAHRRHRLARPHPRHHPPPPRRGAVQDANEWWDAIVDATRRALASGVVDPANVVAVSCTGQYASTVPVDGAGVPVGDCLLWMDSRPAPGEEAVRRTDLGLRPPCPVHLGAPHRGRAVDHRGRSARPPSLPRRRAARGAAARPLAHGARRPAVDAVHRGGVGDARVDGGRVAHRQPRPRPPRLRRRPGRPGRHRRAAAPAPRGHRLGGGRGAPRGRRRARLPCRVAPRRGERHPRPAHRGARLGRRPRPPGARGAEHQLMGQLPGAVQEDRRAPADRQHPRPDPHRVPRHRQPRGRRPEPAVVPRQHRGAHRRAAPGLRHARIVRRPHRARGHR